MLRVTILASPLDLAKEFERCCHEYTSVHIATAWMGNPHHVLPYSHLENFGGEISATIGVSFHHTHPDSIELLRTLKADVRIFRDTADLFHPKLYLFSAGQKAAVFIGSSNLTYSGFYVNIEVNVLIEGVPDSTEEAYLTQLRDHIEKWHSDAFSFVPSSKWIASYRKSYQKRAKSEKEKGIKTPPAHEDEIASASWLRNADWETYYKKVLEGLAKHDRGKEGYIEVLDAARSELPMPWQTVYFDDLQKRRIIGGIGEYG